MIAQTPPSVFIEGRGLWKELIELEFLYGDVVGFFVVLFEIFEVCTSISNHFYQASARMIVFFVLFKMGSELVDLL